MRFVSCFIQGLEVATVELLPSVELRHCFRLLHYTFKGAGHTVKALKDRMWDIAKASHMARFQALIKELQDFDEEAFKLLAKKPPMYWCRSQQENM